VDVIHNVIRVARDGSSRLIITAMNLLADEAASRVSERSSRSRPVLEILKVLTTSKHLHTIDSPWNTQGVLLLQRQRQTSVRDRLESDGP